MSYKTIGDLKQLQAELDERILKSKGLTREETYEKRVRALFIEKAEFLNEVRDFKFWSNKSMDRSKALEEYVDCIHFMLSLAIDCELDLPPYVSANQYRGESVGFMTLYLTQQFTPILKHALHRFKSPYSLLHWIVPFYELGNKLGFTEEEIIAAYLEKNAINHQRQDEGY